MSQQLVKKGPNGRYKNVMPRSWTEAIKDKNTGQSLVEILQGFNMYYLSYAGNVPDTRLSVPRSIRKKGLWITYVKYDGTIVTEWYASDNIEDSYWIQDSKWRLGSNKLVGDISISSDGYWIIDGVKSDTQARGEEGTTPLLRVLNNKLQVSYDLGETYRNVNETPIYTKFRWLTTSEGDLVNTVGRIQASTDEGLTWKDMSNNFVNNLHISKYVDIDTVLPTTDISEGTIYAKGPYYKEDDTLQERPSYRLWVYAWKDDNLVWIDNGEFQSIVAGVTQEIGDNPNVIMSQKAVKDAIAAILPKYVTKDEYQYLVDNNLVEENIEYNIYEDE